MRWFSIEWLSSRQKLLRFWTIINLLCIKDTMSSQWAVQEYRRKMNSGKRWPNNLLVKSDPYRLDIQMNHPDGHSAERRSVRFLEHHARSIIREFRFWIGLRIGLSNSKWNLPPLTELFRRLSFSLWSYFSFRPFKSTSQTLTFVKLTFLMNCVICSSPSIRLRNAGGEKREQKLV